MTIANGKITLQDGSEIDVLTGKKVPGIVNALTGLTPLEAQALVIQTRRKIADLPAIPENTNVMSVILTYTLFGLDDQEIALAAKLPLAQVSKIKMMPEYNSLYETVVNEVLSSNTESVRQFISQNSMSAARSMLELVKHDDPYVRLNSSRDVLDRAGHRPADMIIEQRKKMEESLTIRIIREDQRDAFPTIDLNPIREN